MKKKICIIGAGLSGAYLAQEISKLQKFEVIIFDIDSLKNSKNNSLDLFYENNNRKQKYIDKIQRGYGFGGTSKLWHGGLTIFDDYDLEKIDDQIGNKFSFYLKKNYETIFREYLLNQNEDYGLKKDNFYNLFLNDIFKKKEIFIQNQPLNTKNIILSLKENKYISVVENAICQEIISDKKNTIVSVKISQNNKEKLIYADIFILSAGVFESPRLLLQSMRHNNLLIKNFNIGKNLIDHPFLDIGRIKSTNTTFFKLNYFKKRISSKFSYRISFSFIEKNKSCYLNHSIEFRPISVFNQKIDELKRYINNGKISKILIFLIKNSLNLKLFYNLFCRIYFPSLLKIKECSVILHLDQNPMDEDYISLSNQKDKYGRIIPIIKYGKDRGEFSSIKYAQSLIINNLKNSNFEFISTKSKNFNFYNGNHQCGTARLAKNKKNGVTDQNLKVFDTKNLFICDTSVIPVFGNSNPSLTVFALAKKLSNYLSLNY